jgi:hypothetical protein
MRSDRIEWLHAVEGDDEHGAAGHATIMVA